MQTDPQPTAPLWVRRFELERWIREAFWGWGFLEVRTPLLVQSPGMEPHLKPFQVLQDPPVFLPTSPEFAMKKLLSRGLPKIFQICSSFRDEPKSPEHRPEFTMLEFYETDISLEALQDRVQNLFQTLVMRCHGQLKSSFKGAQVDWSGSWPRYQVNDLWMEHTGIDLRLHTSLESLAQVATEKKLAQSQSSDTWDDLYFKIWLNWIEPKLLIDRPCFVTHYPKSQSSLCNTVRDETGFEWANRFEVYLGQCELGNAFDELRDPQVQRKNFEKDQAIRKAAYGDSWPTSPIDEELLTAIASMPPTCGIALGVDRIAMVVFGVQNLDELVALEPYWREH